MPEKLTVRITELQRRQLQTSGVAIVSVGDKPFVVMNEQGYDQAATLFPLLRTTDFSQAVEWMLDIEQDQSRGLRVAGVAVVYQNGQPLILMNEEGYELAQALLVEHDERRAFVAALLPQ